VAVGPRTEGKRLSAAFAASTPGSPCTSPMRSSLPVPISTYAKARYEVFPIVGIGQPTFQSATFTNGRVTLLQTVDGHDNNGDGTVPRISATPLEMSEAHREIFVAETHASLQNFDAALVNLTSILTGTQIDLSKFRFAVETISIDIDDVYTSNAVVIRAIPSAEAPVTAKIIAATTGQIVKELPLQATGNHFVAITSLSPGPYRITVSAQFQDGPVSATDVFLVVDKT
jgi:hypothetical protein